MTSNENKPPHGDDPNRDQAGSWDPNEQIGDIYEAEIGPEGIRHAEKLSADQPRVWVGSLGDYNNGILHGEWLDAARDPDEIHADISRMLTASPTAAETGQPAEEWAIFDSDNFGPAHIHEHDSIEMVARMACGIAEHGLAFAAWADVCDGDNDMLNGFEDTYLGHYDSVESYAEQLVDDLGYEQTLDRLFPDSLRSYVRFDTAALANDMQLGGDIHAVNANNGGVWIFDGR